jgi:hypothetical protein
MSEPSPSGPSRAYTLREAQYHLTVTSCPDCGKGPWLVDSIDVRQRPPGLAVIHAHCKNCQARREFQFFCEHETSRDAVGTEVINPTDRPSRLVDLGQWLSLFYLLVESAASDASPAATRREGYQAALCLGEALKFYGDDELPSESAFFSETTAAIFRKHPEKFARQKLRDMQAKLPALYVMARNVARDERRNRRPWWRFWQ